jgi:trimethylamine--corrinoid protein Co-methyltransferase
VYYGLGTDLPNFVDLYTGEIRASVLADLENVSKIVQRSDNLDFIAPLGLASDVPQELADLEHLKALHAYCDKPAWVTATDYGNMKAIIDMAAISAGGVEKLRNNPSIGVYTEPISPLVNSKEALQKLLLCAEYGIPVTYASGIMAGATGPATLAGTIALGNAEGLAGLVMHQLKRRGSPFIYGNVCSSMDMSTMVNLYGGPEQPLMHAFTAKFGRFYDIPSYGTGGCSDSHTLDAQAGMEAVFSNFAAGLAGANLVHDNGYLGSGLVGSYEMLLFCNESIGAIKRFFKGIDISAESLALDLIHEVGPAGEFLSDEHTLRHFRNETWHSKFMDRGQFTAWERGGKLTIYDRLNAEAKRITETAAPKLLSSRAENGYDAIIAKRRDEIAQGKYHREDFL